MAKTLELNSSWRSGGKSLSVHTAGDSVNFKLQADVLVDFLKKNMSASLWYKILLRMNLEIQDELKYLMMKKNEI